MLSGAGARRGGACRADDAALRAVEACRARLDAAIDVGIERIAEALPGAAAGAGERALARPAAAARLRERREEISAESLRALAELVRHARTPARSAATRRHATTSTPVLAELGEQGQQGATRWERFKRWLKQKLENRKDDDEAGWLEKWSRQFQTSEGVAQAITYMGYALVGVLVLFVIWSELRAAGLLGGVRRARGAPSPAARMAPAAACSRMSLAAPLAERPGMLLRLLGEALTRAAAAAGRRGPHGRRHRAPRAASIRTPSAPSSRRSRTHGRGGALCAATAARRAASKERWTRRNALLDKIRAPAAGDADARTRHRIPAGAGARWRRSTDCGCARAVARSRRRCRAAHHAPNGAAMATRACSNGCSVPASRCVPCASVTPR